MGLILHWDAGGEPRPAAGVADEEHGAGAVTRWYRRQYIVDFEIAIGRQWDASKVGVVQGKGGRGFTDQRGKDALSRCSPDIIAPTQN